MARMRPFELIAVTPPAAAQPALAIAASRAGGVGVLDLTFTSVSQAQEAVDRFARYGRGNGGARLDRDWRLEIGGWGLALPPEITTVVLAGQAATAEAVEHYQADGRRVWLEVTSVEQALRGEAWGVDGVIAKGQEAGGWVGEETTFILVQRLIQAAHIPIYAQGGIGRHTAAAVYAAGAAGVVLDAQLALLPESQLPDNVKAAIAAMDGSETARLGHEFGHGCRMYQRPGAKGVEALRALAGRLERDEAAAWREAVVARVGWGPYQENVWLLGQDAAFAKGFADHYHNVSGVFKGLRASLEEHVAAVRRLRPLDEDSPLAQSHGTRYPIVQGPMTRVSDRAPFALAVAEGGGLPFLALALMRAPEVEQLLQETSEVMGGRAWGVGILGFVPLALRQEQLEVALRYKPPFAIIAGGRPDQALRLEKEGIQTYLHVPSPGLLKLFLQDGARRFIFEGRECGGHIGPRSSFVLWESMIEVILDNLPADAGNVHVLFAGGVHDARSAAMVAALAAPLAVQGVKVGALMGTAYLFTEEAVASGAILPNFQQEALQCDHTVTVESGPGHAIRCVHNPFTAEFEQTKRQWLREGVAADRARERLDELNIGRLRIASKGVTRHPRSRQEANAPEFVTLNTEEQHQQGMFMIGQLAALRNATCSIAELHHEVAVEGMRRLEIGDEGLGMESPISNPQSPSRVAIVGVECLLPGADNRQAFWENVLNGVYAITEIPAERWDADLYFDADPAAKDKIYSKWGGFLNNVPFDPVEFGMPPNSLNSIDPMQLLALKVAKAALADAGYGDLAFDRSRTSVILGASGGTGDLGALYLLRSGLPLLFGEQAGEIIEAAGDLLPEWTEDSFAGLLLNVAAGRIANRLDLGGLNYVVDAACGSSLAAVHLAVRELESGHSDVVIAGGVDTVQNPFGYLCFSKTQALSASGRPRTFDAEADGIAISEGIVMMVLKRLADAERDGDRIYAVIQGSAGSSDGRAKGLTAPRPEGQMLALQRAYAKAGIDPTTVALFEAHGTGTAVGDRTEAISLGTFLEEAGAKANSHAVGSVKSMIGHTKATAGVAGLAKVALSLYHKVLPPTLGVSQPNPQAGFGRGPLYVNSETRPWIHGEDGPRRAGVSAFGFGGTNFHVVVEEYQGEYLNHRPATAATWPSELLLFSGRDRQEITAILESLAGALQQGAKPALRDLAYSLWRRFDSQAPARLAIVTASVEELQQKLKIDLAGFPDLPGLPDVYYSETAIGGKVAFLFPGQGSHYPNMMRDLALHFEAARRAFETADAVLASEFDRPLSRFVFPPPAFDEATRQAQAAALTATNVAQPALGAADMAVLHLLATLGVKPEMAAGHSYGEYVALYAAGVIDAETLIRLSAARGRAIVAAAGQELGTMAAVGAGEAQTRTILDGMAEVWIANVNAPQQTIISGTEAGIAQAVARFEAAGVRCRPIQVAAAFHSPIVAPAQERLAAHLQAARYHAPQMAVYANTTAGLYPAEAAAIQALLAEHLARPVRFVEEIEAMYAAGARVFVEAGPRNMMTNLVRQILEDRPHLAVIVDRPGEHGVTQLQRALGQLAVNGVGVKLDALFAGRNARLLDLRRLAEETQPVPLSPTTWLVNGSAARPHTQPAKKRTAGSGKRSAVSRQPSAGSGQPSAVSQEKLKADSFLADSFLMVQFQGVMSRFLETQRNVMMAYLGGQPSDASRQLSAVSCQPSAISRSGMAAEERLSNDVPVEPESLATSPQPPTLDRETLTTKLLAIVSERTGYPAEMLALDVDVEADLGIDSIKRVEFLGVFIKEALPANGLAQDAMDQLAAVKTLGGMVDWVVDGLGREEAVGQSPIANLQSPPLLRSMLVPVAAEAPAVRPLSFLAERVVVITDDGRGVAAAVAARVRGQGGWPVVVTAAEVGDADAVGAKVESIGREYGPIGGILHLSPLAGQPPLEEMDLAAWRAHLRRDVKSLFYLLKYAGPSLTAGQDSFVAAAGCLEAYPGQGGMSGLLKTAAKEWSSVRAQVLDLDDGEPPEQWVEQIWQELAAAEPEVAARYRQGQRQRLEHRPMPLAKQAKQLEITPGDVILVTGGARGITAEVALHLARQYRPTLVLIGRSPLPPTEEAAETAGLDDPKAIKMAMVNRLRQDERPVALAEVEQAYRRLLAEREIRRNLAALAETGATVRYYAADVRDEAAMRHVVASVVEAFGRVDGIIHGAGIIEDKLISDKTPESFDRVFDTKADSTFILSKLLGIAGKVKFVALFSSVSGAFGNRGQADYAAANEVMNKMAAYLDGRAPGRAVSLCWGPWASAGMVNEGLARHFAEQGMGLIAPAAGSRALEAELLWGEKGRPEVIYVAPVEDDRVTRWQGDKVTAPESVTLSPPHPVTLSSSPPHLVTLSGNGRHPLPLLAAGEVRARGQSVEVVRPLDPAHDRYLLDHRLDGRPVLPAAVAMELMAEVAQYGWPDLEVVGVRDLQVLKGVVLDGVDATRRLRVVAKAQAAAPVDHLGANVDVQISDADDPRRLHYRAVIELGRRPDEAPTYKIPPGLPLPPMSVAEAYRQWLFHGPIFQAITTVDGLGAADLVATIRPSVPAEALAMNGHAMGDWLIDPVVFDSGLQAIIVWARAQLDATPLISGLRRYRRYGSLSAGPVKCHLQVDRGRADHILMVNMAFVDGNGRLAGLAEGITCPYTDQLNRLAGKEEYMSYQPSALSYQPAITEAES